MKYLVSLIVLVTCFYGTLSLISKPSQFTHTSTTFSSHAKNYDFTISQNLQSEISRLRREIKSREYFNSAQCEKFLSSINEAVYELPSDYFDRSNWSDVTLITIVQDLFQTQLDLRAAMKDFYVQGTLTENCSIEMRKSLRAIRFVSDYLGQIYSQHLFSGRPPYNSLPSLQENLAAQVADTGLKSAKTNFTYKTDIRSGDIFLTRGAKYSSASIARIGDFDSQFSHLTLVYVDPKSKAAYTIESHIEDGVSIKPIAEHFKQNNVRRLHFRYSDPELAHQAALLAYDFLKNRTVNYDIEMNSMDRKRMYCSEIINLAFNLLLESGIKVDVPPLFWTKLGMKNRDYLDKVGVKSATVFLPSDMEVDPRFEIISEWRDFTRIHDSWLKDAIFTKIYEWMETQNYHLESPGTIGLLEFVGNTPGLRQIVFGTTNVVSNIFGKTIVPNLSGTAIAASKSMDLAAGIIQYKLEEKIKGSKFYPGFSELLKLIEDIRISDKAEFDSGNKNTFHSALNNY